MKVLTYLRYRFLRKRKQVTTLPLGGLFPRINKRVGLLDRLTCILEGHVKVVNSRGGPIHCGTCSVVLFDELATY